MHVEVCTSPQQWDAYVEGKQNAFNYHRWCWKQIIERTFEHSGHYLAAMQGKTICGILPLFDVRSRLFGHFLVSVPFFSYGGILADSEEATRALSDEAVRLARQVGASHIELRHVDAIGPWDQAVSKVTMVVNLPRTPDEYLRRLSSGMRKKIRYASQADLQADWGGIELVPEFYEVFSSNMRNLGTPVYPVSWFVNQLQGTPGSIRIVLLREGKNAVFAAFVSTFRDRVELPWAASLRSAREKHSQLALYWTLIEWAIRNGFRTCDLGRCTPNGGPYRFKEHWGCDESPLRWQYWPGNGAPAPRLQPDNKKYQLAVGLWKRLPLPVANVLGPKVVRGLP